MSCSGIALQLAYNPLVFFLLLNVVIRLQLAGMIAKVEAVQSWLENITYQMTTMNYKEQSKHLAGPIALLKVSPFAELSFR